MVLGREMTKRRPVNYSARSPNYAEFIDGHSIFFCAEKGSIQTTRRI
jgi:hypothetical protein